MKNTSPEARANNQIISIKIPPQVRNSLNFLLLGAEDLGSQSIKNRIRERNGQYVAILDSFVSLAGSEQKKLQFEQIKTDILSFYDLILLVCDLDEDDLQKFAEQYTSEISNEDSGKYAHRIMETVGKIKSEEGLRDYLINVRNEASRLDFTEKSLEAFINLLRRN